MPISIFISINIQLVARCTYPLTSVVNMAWLLAMKLGPRDMVVGPVRRYFPGEAIQSIFSFGLRCEIDIMYLYEVDVKRIKETKCNYVHVLCDSWSASKLGKCVGTISTTLKPRILRTLGTRGLIFGTTIEVGVVYVWTGNESLLVSGYGRTCNQTLAVKIRPIFANL